MYAFVGVLGNEMKRYGIFYSQMGHTLNTMSRH